MQPQAITIQSLPIECIESIIVLLAPRQRFTVATHLRLLFVRNQCLPVLDINKRCFTIVSVVHDTTEMNFKCDELFLTVFSTKPAGAARKAVRVVCRQVPELEDLDPMCIKIYIKEKFAYGTMSNKTYGYTATRRNCNGATDGLFVFKYTMDLKALKVLDDGR